MQHILREVLFELFTLLEYDVKEKDVVVTSLANDVEKETVKEIQEGLSLASSKIKSFTDAKNKLEKAQLLEVFETAASRILVNFYASNKKRYSERQREIFLTFLLTNKLKRELER